MLAISATCYADPTVKARHDRMAQLVERMLGLRKELAGARTPMDKRGIERQIEAMDGQIDRMCTSCTG